MIVTPFLGGGELEKESGARIIRKISAGLARDGGIGAPMIASWKFFPAIPAQTMGSWPFSA